MTVILPLAIAIIVWFCPTKAQVILLLANVFIPDSVPYVDEIIQVVGLIKGISS